MGTKVITASTPSGVARMKLPMLLEFFGLTVIYNGAVLLIKDSVREKWVRSSTSGLINFHRLTLIYPTCSRSWPFLQRSIALRRTLFVFDLIFLRFRWHVSLRSPTAESLGFIPGTSPNEHTLPYHRHLKAASLVICQKAKNSQQLSLHFRYGTSLHRFSLKNIVNLLWCPIMSWLRSSVGLHLNRR